MISAIVTGAKVVEADIEELVDHTQKFMQQVGRSKTQGGFTPEQWEALQKQRNEFLKLLNNPALRKKLTPGQRKQVDDIKKEVVQIFPINKPIHLNPPKR